MWSSVEQVAISQFLPEKELVQFAILHEHQFSIDLTIQSVPYVSTFHVDSMINLFRNTYPVLCDTVRARKIEIILNENILRENK